MKVEELKKFIIKARSNDAVKFSEFADTLYINCYSLREELFKKYQFRDSKTFEIVDLSNVSEKVKAGVFKYFISILIRKTHTLAKFNDEVRKPVYFHLYKDIVLKELRKMPKHKLEEVVDTYNKHYAEVVTPQNLLKLVSDTKELSSQVLKEIPEAVIYLTDEEPGWTLRGVLREYYDSIYGSEVCDKPSDRTPADYLEEIHSSARSDSSIADYYEKIGKCDL